MLTAFRRLASTWVAKALFLVLVLSFGIWGIGDMVRNFGRDYAVARVNGQPIEMEEAQNAFRREMQRLQRTLGGQFENDPRVRQAIAAQAVDSLIMDRVLRAETERLRIAVPDEAVRQFVLSIPGFQGPDHQFSRVVFESFLRSNGLSEPQFLALVRADLARQQVEMAIRSGATPPDALAKPLLQWQQEQRAVTLVTLPLSAAPEPPAPDEAALRRFHENNPDQFSSPEYREAAVAVLTAQLISREVQITEDELRSAFDQRRGQFETPEKRELQQALVQDEAKAKEIAERWRTGADFSAISAEAQADGGSAVDLGLLDRGGLPVPELAEAAFNTPAGGVTAPVHSPFGWHVLKVVKIEPGHTRSFEEVREQLRNDLAQEKAADMAFERANQVEDALAGGATLQEAAERYHLGFKLVRTDASGNDPDGKPVELPVIEAARPALLHAIFTAERGAPPKLQETEAGFVAVDLRDVTPPALRPFESVEPQVRAAWIADAKRRSQEERAASLLAATRGGKPLAEAAKEAGLGSREVGGLQRDQRQNAAVPPEILAPVFELKQNEATMAPTRDGFAVAQLLEITRPDPDAEPDALRSLRSQVEQAMAQDLEAQWLAALRARADVRVNQRLVETIAQP